MSPFLYRSHAYLSSIVFERVLKKMAFEWDIDHAGTTCAIAIKKPKEDDSGNYLYRFLSKLLRHPSHSRRRDGDEVP